MHPSHRALLQHHATARPGNVFCRGSELSGVWRICHLDISQQSESRWRRNATRRVSHASTPRPLTPTAKEKGRCLHTDGLMQERRNSSALAMELRLSCINPYIIIISSSCTVIIVRIHDHMLDTHCVQRICIFAIHIIHTHNNT